MEIRSCLYALLQEAQRNQVNTFGEGILKNEMLDDATVLSKIYIKTRRVMRLLFMRVGGSSVSKLDEVVQYYSLFLMKSQKISGTYFAHLHSLEPRVAVASSAKMKIPLVRFTTLEITRIGLIDYLQVQIYSSGEWVIERKNLK